MKVKLVLLTLIIVAVGISGIAYHDYQAHKSVVSKAVKTEQQLNTELTSARQFNDKLTAKYNILWEQCVNGAAAYKLLTPAQQSKTPEPACGLSIVQ